MQRSLRATTRSEAATWTGRRVLPRSRRQAKWRANLAVESWHGTPADVVLLAPNVLSVRHWDRRMRGALYAATPRLDWASLLRRSFEVDVLQCPKRQGRLRVIALITEREPVQRILAHPGVSTEAPPVSSPSKRSWAFRRSAMGRMGARRNVQTTPSDRSRRKRRELPAICTALLIMDKRTDSS